MKGTGKKASSANRKDEPNRMLPPTRMVNDFSMTSSPACSTKRSICAVSSLNSSIKWPVP